jgi:hypothetical protein
MVAASCGEPAGARATVVDVVGAVVVGAVVVVVDDGGVLA